MMKFMKKSLVFGLSLVSDMLEKTLSPDKNQNIEKRRENAKKIWENNPKNNSVHDQLRKETSMLASQGKSDHSGSAYHGPGNIDHEKVDSNMAQRNFNNHDSNRLG